MRNLNFMAKIISIFLLVFLSCTTTEIYHRSPMYKQRLVVRKGFDGFLTNQVCEEYKKGKCVKWDIIKYDVNDSKFRKKVNDFNITCRVATKRWRICLDKPGFCRRTLKCVEKCWYWLFSCCKYEELFISINDYQYLLDANTYCIRE